MDLRGTRGVWMLCNSRSFSCSVAEFAGPCSAVVRGSVLRRYHRRLHGHRRLRLLPRRRRLLPRRRRLLPRRRGRPSPRRRGSLPGTASPSRSQGDLLERIRPQHARQGRGASHSRTHTHDTHTHAHVTRIRRKGSRRMSIVAYENWIARAQTRTRAGTFILECIRSLVPVTNMLLISARGGACVRNQYFSRQVS